MNPRPPGALSLFGALFALASLLPAQTPAPAAAPSAAPAPAATPAAPRAPANLVSPEVAADRKVTFRVFAPESKKANLLGTWNNNTPQEMTKNADGVWSVTVGPLEPGFWLYSFNLDGLDLADPVNPIMKLRARTSASFVNVPSGNTSLAWEARTDVPHGAVDINFHNSKVTGDARYFYVYTPPGYDPAAATRYPVLYLFHGNNGTAADWTTAGRANFIADNLLAAQKMVPMIIVMPWGHATPFGGRGDNNAVFERYLLDEVVPAVEAKYRVKTERENRAIMGLSMGGGHALRIGLGNLEKFAWVAGYSSATIADFDTRFKDLLANSADTNAKLKLLWIACGKQDTLFASNERMDATFTKNNIKHTWVARDGFHTFDFWIRCLEDTAPLLFR